MKEKQLEQAILYFKKYAVYDRLFASMREKYASLGHLGGSFVLANLTVEEKNTISGFVGRDLGKDTTVKISFSALDKALAKSKFGVFAWEEILVEYYKQPLLVRKEERLHKKEEQNIFWESCLSGCTSENVRMWLSGLLLEHKNGYQLLGKQYSSDREELKQMLKKVICALEQLPVNGNRKLLLPVFAAEITGNPHYFDDKTTACKLLLNYGKYRFGQADIKLSGVEQRESLLYKMGILKDDLSNICLAYGVAGRKEDGFIHEGLQGFCREKQAVQMTLNTLGGLCSLESTEDMLHRVYIVENPAVFSYLAKKYPDYTFLCTTGQLKLASYVTMDLFPKTYTFYYAGDFDPEGLRIAQGLKKRYGKRLVLWNYKKEYYERAVSGQELDAARLKKLDKIDVVELQDIKQCLLTYKKAAYQERMLDVYVVRK